MANKDACNDLPSLTSTQKSDLTIKLDSQIEMSAGLKYTRCEVERLAFVASNSAASASGSTEMHRRSELLTRKCPLVRGGRNDGRIRIALGASEHLLDEESGSFGAW